MQGRLAGKQEEGGQVLTLLCSLLVQVGFVDGLLYLILPEDFRDTLGILGAMAQNDEMVTQNPQLLFRSSCTIVSTNPSLEVTW